MLVHAFAWLKTMKNIYLMISQFGTILNIGENSPALRNVTFILHWNLVD